MAVAHRLTERDRVTGFFSALLAASRRRTDCDLSLWWSERHCANRFDRIAQPDGLRVGGGGNSIVFCLEYDRSIETLECLEKKAKGYVDLQIASGLAYWICFCFGHPRREVGAWRVLAQRPTVPVTTAALGATQRPHEAIWAPAGYEGLRLRLDELLSVPIPSESEERIAETQAYRRRTFEQWQRV